MILTTNRLVTFLFLILLAGSMFFYLERILFCDASFILFRIINMDSLQIQEHRYGSFITQSFPWLSAKLGLPLQMIVLLYSASFNLFYLAVAALLIFRFGQTSLAVLMSFYYLLFVSDTYFWTNNEVHQGVAWMFLFFGVTLSLGKKGSPPILLLPLFLILAFLSIYSHPLVLFPASFLWLFFMMRKDWPFSRNWTIVLSILLFLVSYSKFALSTGQGSHYDADKLHAATHLSFKKIFAAFTSPMAKEIVKRSIWNYWLIPILFFSGIYFTWQQKKYRILGLTLFFSLAYFLAVCITYNDFIPFYTESEWMAGSIIFTTLFVFYVLPLLRPRSAVMILSVIYLVRLAYIGQASIKWTERKEWIYSWLDEMKSKKIHKGYIYESEENKKILIMNWGVPTESIIASALRKDHPQMSFVVDKPENISQRMPAFTGQMIAPFETISIESLNPQYFNFDTSAQYQFIAQKSIR